MTAKQRKKDGEKKPTTNTPARNNPYKNDEYHECGWDGHTARSCQYANCGRDKEAHGRREMLLRPIRMCLQWPRWLQRESVSPDVEEALTQYEHSHYWQWWAHSRSSTNVQDNSESSPIESSHQYWSPATFVSLNRVIDVLSQDRL